MSKVLLLSILLISLNGLAQDSKWSKLGSAEKFWVITHPFRAKKAYKLSKKAVSDLDSLKKVQRLKSLLLYPNMNSGSRFDALRHAYWMALTSYHIGPKRALSLGRAHEKKNEEDFKEGRLEDSLDIDKMAIEMDLKNNIFGSNIGKYCKDCDDLKLLNTVLEALRVGELLIIKQNENGEFLSSEGEILKPVKWVGKWENDRILVPSNYGL